MSEEHTRIVRRAERGRGLRAVVFLDTVSSTPIAAELGDERWQTLLRRELQILRRLLKECGGEEVDVAGDGLFALFREPAPAVRFAAAASAAVREVGLEIRAGVHFGEVEFADGRPAGIVVHTGARAMAVGQAGDVIVTQGVRDLLSGGRLVFTEHGTHELKGVPGTWTLFRLTEVDDEPVEPPLVEEEAGARRDDTSRPAPLVRRRTFLAGAGVAVVAGTSAGAILLGREEPSKDDRSSERPRAGNRLYRYDPTTDELSLLPTTLGGLPEIFPCLAVGEGGVWTGDNYLHHVDPQDGSVRHVSSLSRGNTDIVVAITTGFESVWVLMSSGLYRLGPGDDQEHGFAPIGPAYQGGVTTGLDSVWAAMDTGRLARIDPGPRLGVIANVVVGDVLSDVVVAGDEVWVSDEFGQLARFDPTKKVAEESVPIAGSPKGLTATPDRLWAVDPDSGSVFVVDTATRTPIKTIPVGGEPVDVAAGLDAVWVADHEGGLVKVNEAGLFVEEQKPVPGPVAAIAIDNEREVIWLRTN